MRALKESAEAIVVTRRSERGEERRAEEPKSRAKKKLANERPNRHARREDAITAITTHPTKKGPVVQPSQPDRGHAEAKAPRSNYRKRATRFNRRMLKTACPVVWEGHGAQSP